MTILLLNLNSPFKLISEVGLGLFSMMSGLWVRMLHFLKDWWKFIQIHQYYTMALRCVVDFYDWPVAPGSRWGFAQIFIALCLCLYHQFVCRMLQNPGSDSMGEHLEPYKLPGPLTLNPIGLFWGLESIGGGGGLFWPPPPQISATNRPIDLKIGTVVKQVK